jgi:hypothetical protein
MFGRHGNPVGTSINAQKIQIIQACIRPNVAATRPNALQSSRRIQCSKRIRLDASQCSTSKMISFADTDMGRQLQMSERQVYTVRTPVLITEFTCSRSATVQTLGQHRSDAALILYSVKRVIESRLHSCPFRLFQLPSRRRLEKSIPDSI